MATNVVALGRRILIGLVLIAACIELAADSLASFVGGRIGEGVVYGAMMFVMLLVGLSIDSVKTFLED